MALIALVDNLWQDQNMGSGNDLVLHYLLATFQIAGHGTLLGCVWKWGNGEKTVFQWFSFLWGRFQLVLVIGEEIKLPFLVRFLRFQ